MRVFSYVVARDFGFAPNPFHGWCTLATCKPKIRSVAQIGDWVFGTGSVNEGLRGRAIYAMRVDEILTFEEYWADPRFRLKRPNLAGSRKLAFGDNIYSRSSGADDWTQRDSHHSFRDGSPNQVNVQTDTGVNRVLVARDFIYWGGSGPEVPPHLTAFGHDAEDIRSTGRGHRSRFSTDLVAAANSWLSSIRDRGYQGRPDQWPRSA